MCKHNQVIKLKSHKASLVKISGTGFNLETGQKPTMVLPKHQLILIFVHEVIFLKHLDSHLLLLLFLIYFGFVFKYTEQNKIISLLY